MRSEQTFQFTWVVLHFAAAVLHLGSVVYHFTKFVRRERASL